MGKDSWGYGKDAWSSWGGKGGYGPAPWGGKGKMDWGKGKMDGGKFGKGKGKSKDPNRGKGHTLPRERITAEKFMGTVIAWKGKYGWIQPAEEIQHEKASKHKGGLFAGKDDSRISHLRGLQRPGCGG